MNNERARDAAARVGLSLLGEPGDSDLGQLVETYGAPRAVEMIQEQLVPPEISPKAWNLALGRWLPRIAVLESNDQMERAHRAQAHLVLPGDDQWPDSLDDLGPHAPLLLWVRGDAGLLRRAGVVAIVGARAATAYGEFVAADLAGALARSGITVVSGGAYGIDGVAHRAALGVHGRTIAVMAGGVDRFYPAGHAALISQVAREGAVISEVALGVTPSRWRFLARNRLIAALSDATVVVEAGWRSGSLNTAGHAAALGRALGAVPGPVTSPASAGCHRLMREYDAVCITTPDEVRELAGWNAVDDKPAAEKTKGAVSDDAGSIRSRVVDALSMRVARDIDAIARRTGCAIAEVQAAIGLMVLEGVAQTSEEGYVLTVSGKPGRAGS